jgi:hypothetical protein
MRPIRSKKSRYQSIFEFTEQLKSFKKLLFQLLQWKI